MPRFGTSPDELATLARALRTAAYLLLVVLAGCEVTGPVPGQQPCRTDRDCRWPSEPVCRCDLHCWSSRTAAPDAGVDAVAPAMHTYVLAALRAYPSDPSRTAFGIDLDQRVGGTDGSCTDAMDYASAVTSEPGVDNQLVMPLQAVDAALGGDGWDGAIADAIETGVMGIVIEVGQGEGESCARRVHLWTARPASGTAPEASASCAALVAGPACDSASDGACFSSRARSTCSGIAAGQTWVALDDLGEVDGLVAAGRLQTNALPRLTLVPILGLPGMPAVASPLDLHDVILEADLHDDVLARGELGGAIHITDAVDWVNAHLFTSAPTNVATFSDFVLPDLAPSPDGYTCADFSAGFGFTAIAASIVH